MVRSGQTRHVIEIKVALDADSIGEEEKSLIVSNNFLMEY